MKLSKNTTVNPKDIAFPRTMVLEGHGIVAVFRDPSTCLICLALENKSDDEKEAKEEKKITISGKEYVTSEIVGMNFAGLLNINDEVDGESWRNAAEENLVWCYEDGVIGWQNGDDVTIVDFTGSQLSGLGKIENIEEHEWTNIIDFASKLKIHSTVLVAPIKHEEVVLFNTKSELDQYLIMILGYVPATQEEIYKSPLFPADMVMELPMIQSKLYSFPLNNTDALLLKKTALHKLLSFDEWKATR